MDLSLNIQFYYDRLIKEISGSCYEGVADDIIEKLDELLDKIYKEFEND